MGKEHYTNRQKLQHPIFTLAQMQGVD